MNNKCRSQRNIILKEDDWIITDTTELCEIISIFFSYCANYIWQPDEIEMGELDFLTNIIDRNNNHKSILAIKGHTLKWWYRNKMWKGSKPFRNYNRWEVKVWYAY